MASKRTKNAPTTDELDELFEGIGDERATDKKKTTPSNKAKAGKAGGSAGPAAEKDILAELENELGEKQSASRPHTPRIAGGGGHSGARGSPARKAASGGAPSATPPATEDASTLPRRSAESTNAGAGRTSLDKDNNTAVASGSGGGGNDAGNGSGGGGGGWWGGIMSTASAAMKQAEAAVKEIQRNEEAKKWAEQVRGNVSVLRGYGDELRHRALPTFATILHTLAPPIASHERLHIHITHDMVGYPSLDPLVHGVFARVMAQVEGGDLLVIQRGQENTAARADEAPTFFSGVGGGGAAPGWQDGPWWRAVDSLRDIGAVQGLHEGTKLCRASAESYAHEYYAAQDDGTGGLEQARQRAVEPMSESNPVRRSDLFLAVQAITTTVPVAGAGNGAPALFAGPAKADEEDAGAEAATEDDTYVSFAVYVLDPVHEIVFHTVSQTLPAKWVRWLDAPPTLTPATSVEDAHETGAAAAADYAAASAIPDDIREIVEDGGVDPREWVAEWVEETLSLAVGVVAQRYVARRMGVGEGSIGKGKRQMHAVLEDGGGEAARAGLI